MKPEHRSETLVDLMVNLAILLFLLAWPSSFATPPINTIIDAFAIITNMTYHRHHYYTHCWPWAGIFSVFYINWEFCVADIILYVMWNIKWFYLVIQGNILIAPKYVEFGIATNPCIVEPGYRLKTSIKFWPQIPHCRSARSHQLPKYK